MCKQIAKPIDAGSKDLVIVLAMVTTGRRDVVSAVMPHAALQTRLPDAMLICVADENDVDRSALATLPFDTTLVRSEKGLTRQRNRVLEEIAIAQHGADVVVFVDDDFLMSPSYLAETATLFAQYPSVVVATGRVLADGIKSCGIDLKAALSMIADDASTKRAPSVPRDTYNAYGCNMAIRLLPVLRDGVRFDEALPLYSWLEDIDFSRELARYGRIVRSEALRGVHLGTKRGRTSGLRFGYSQIANPIYLASKQSLTPRRAFLRIARNIIANTLRFLRPEPWVDRRGRLFGNLLALRDLVGGRLAPDNILRFP